MNDIGEGTIRRIDWTELTPIVLLLRVFNIALGVRVLAWAMIGLWSTLLLESVSGISFLTNLVKQDSATVLNLGRSAIILNNIWNTRFVIQQEPLQGLWLIAVLPIWIICGGMICRIVAVRLTIDESESTKNLLLFFRKRGMSFVSAHFLLILGILLCFLPVLFAGRLLAVPVLNYVVAVLFPLPILFAFFTVLLALGLAVGFMLLFAAVSADGSDGYDAISRMFSYIFQRPLHYVFYWICCGVLGGLGYYLVFFVFTYPVLLLCGRFADVPCDSFCVVEFFVKFWLTFLCSLQVAYVFAWFWTSSVAIYLLLRRSVDATPFNEVYRVSSPTVRTLPTIKPDVQGAPEIVSDH